MQSEGAFREDYLVLGWIVRHTTYTPLRLPRAGPQRGTPQHGVLEAGRRIRRVEHPQRNRRGATPERGRNV